MVHATEFIDKKNANTLIEVDGGVMTGNASQLAQLGADVLVAGSSVFNSENPMKTIEELVNA